MELAVITFPYENIYEYDLTELAAERNLLYYASEAADQMSFESLDELQGAVERAMQVCQAGGLSIKTNFKRVFKCSSSGLVFDWKLSELAYCLVRLNGDASNPRVARLQIGLLKAACE